MKIEIRIAGLGGQGVVLAGKILGKAAVFDGLFAVQTQSYGAEARGSAAKSEVIISDKPIWFPFVRKCDFLIALSQQALDKYLKDLKKDGKLVVDSTYVREVPEKFGKKPYSLPFCKNAKEKFGNEIFANVIALGFLAKAFRLVSEESLRKAIVGSVPSKYEKENIEAFKLGIKLAEEI